MKGENKGITLIALIIVVVVVLILAAVTISAVNDGGIFQYANNAATKYNSAATDENISLTGWLATMREHDPDNQTPPPGGNVFNKYNIIYLETEEDGQVYGKVFVAIDSQSVENQEHKFRKTTDGKGYYNDNKSHTYTYEIHNASEYQTFFNTIGVQLSSIGDTVFLESDANVIYYFNNTYETLYGGNIDLNEYGELASLNSEFDYETYLTHYSDYETP